MANEKLTKIQQETLNKDFLKCFDMSEFSRAKEKQAIALLKQGADPNTCNADGENALHLMTYMRTTTFQSKNQDSFSKDLFDALVDAGIDKDKQDKSGNTPLIRAAFFERPDEDFSRWLIKAGAKADIKNDSGRDALMNAAFRGNLKLCQDLHKAGADIFAKDNKKQTAADITKHEDVKAYLKKEMVNASLTKTVGVRKISDVVQGR